MDECGVVDMSVSIPSTIYHREVVDMSVSIPSTIYHREPLSSPERGASFEEGKALKAGQIGEAGGAQGHHIVIKREMAYLSLCCDSC